MAGRIAISDPKLAKRVEKAVADLGEAYPDKTVRRLDQDHKSLGKRLSKLWKEVGYGSREELLNAYGFSTDAHAGHEGRPKSDLEPLLAELEKRYEGKSSPATVSGLIAENPDLKGQLKTFQNTSKERFGKSAANVLRERGLLGRRSSAEPAPKPVTATKPVEKPVAAKVVEKHVPTRDELLEDAYRLVEELGERLCDVVPATQKPEDVSGLIEACPKWADRIKSAQKLHVIGKGKLQKLGILYDRRCTAVEGTAPEKLIALLPDSLKGTVVSPEEAKNPFAPWVCGVDLASGVELRTATVGAWHDGPMSLEVGARYGVRVNDPAAGQEGMWQRPVPTVEVLSEPAFQASLRFGASLFYDAINESPSELAKHIGAKLVSTSGYGNRTFAVFEVSYLAPIATPTLVSLLREQGIVTDSDLAGGMGWRVRLWKMRREEGEE